MVCTLPRSLPQRHPLPTAHCPPDARRSLTHGQVAQVHSRRTKPPDALTQCTPAMQGDSLSVV